MIRILFTTQRPIDSLQGVAALVLSDIRQHCDVERTSGKQIACGYDQLRDYMLTRLRHTDMAALARSMGATIKYQEQI